MFAPTYNDVFLLINSTILWL